MFITCCLYCFGFVVYSNMVLADNLLMDSRHKPHPVPDSGTSHKRVKRIINGQEITPHSRPYMVYLEIGSFGFCGGTILDNSTILTAAHCYKNNQVRVTAGAHNKKVNEGTKQISNVKSVYIHEQYIELDEKNKMKNDIAILKLASPLDLGRPEVKSLSMNTNPSCPVADSLCRVTGWGDTTGQGTLSDVPREANVKVISNSNCYNGTVFDTEICAIGDICINQLSGSSCKGDSGGPLACVCDGEYKIVGIVSWTKGTKAQPCGLKDCPGVYTRVSSYIKWIDEKCEVGKYGLCYHTSGIGTFLQGSVQRSAIITTVAFVFRLSEL